MKTLGNIIWFIFGGLLAAIGYFILGLLLCITIIGIPFGMQLFKYAGLMLTPFGNDVNLRFEKHPIMNIIWVIVFGWELAIGFVVLGVLYSVTIIGIPFGMQWFKFAKLSLFPFGAEIR